jgi:ribonuclease HI
MKKASGSNNQILISTPIITHGITAFFDGATWPNPGGPCGAGALIKRDGVTIFSESRFIPPGETTNNVAEYTGLVLVLELLHQHKIPQATIYGDSNLVVMQMSGLWQVKRNSRKPKLYVPFYDVASKLSEGLKLTFEWIPRELNAEADRLSNKPLIDRGIRNPYK